MTTDEDDWPIAVADLPERSRKIVERLLAITGPKPSQRLVKEVVGIDRGTWRKIRGGDTNVAAVSYRRAENALAEREAELGIDVASTTEVEPVDFVEFELTVDAIGLHIIGKGTTANMAEVRKQVADLYHEIRKGERTE